MYLTQTKTRNPNKTSARRKPASFRKSPNWTRKQTAIGALGVALTSALLYLPILRNPFISFDDREYVTENPVIKAGLTWHTFAWAWTSFDHANWHPITWISHAVDVQFFGMSPAGHHLTSLLFHAANAALLFLFLAKATRSPAMSLAVAAVFAVHPLNVESVAWVAERKNLLCAFWSLLGLLAYLGYSQQPIPRRLAAVAGLFFMALASKPMAVTFPFLLLLLDRWPLERVASWRQLLTTKSMWVEKIPLFALSGASCIITLIAQHRSNSIVAIAVLPVSLRLENAIVSYGFYGLKLVWPAGLAFLYPWPSHAPGLWALVSSVTFLVGISVFAWSERERRPYVLAGWLWFLGALVPVIGMVQVGSQARADRYAYIPMIGLLIAAVWLMADIMRELKRYKVGIALLVSTTVALGLCSRKQIDYWRSNYDLWLHAFQVTADNYLAADKVGVALQDEGRPEEAYPYFEQVLRINSADPLANFNVGVKSHLQGDIRGAIRFYQVTANQETDPMLRAEAFENMGTAYRQLGDLPAARESYLKALQYDPRRSRIYTVLREMGASPAL
jgi:hypothetical protein